MKTILLMKTLVSNEANDETLASMIMDVILKTYFSEETFSHFLYAQRLTLAIKEMLEDNIIDKARATRLNKEMMKLYDASIATLVEGGRQ